MVVGDYPHKGGPSPVSNFSLYWADQWLVEFFFVLESVAKSDNKKPIYYIRIIIASDDACSVRWDVGGDSEILI